MQQLDGNVAAVDLGSNSFHLIVMRQVAGQSLQVDKLRERVALADGLDSNRELTPVAMQRAVSCLKRFGERLVDIPPERMRVVGTSALRQAANRDDFLAQAECAVGHQIEIIEGGEEARLIYLGVAHGFEDGLKRRLVIDIGGGSTECIIGEQYEPLRADSLQIGCVQSSRAHFAKGKLCESAFAEAETAAGLELQHLVRIYGDLGWESCVGASGTVQAVEAIVAEMGLSPGGITPKSLKRLKKHMLQAGSVDALQLPGLQADRRPVLAGGLAILRALFDAFGIERMDASKSALREGVIYDLLGRMQHEDVREHTVRRIARRHHVDEEQAARVRRTAFGIFDQLSESWELSVPADRQHLGWASELHEVGVAVAFSGHHKHGAYVIANTTMPGFSRAGQRRLAALILCHRRKLSPERAGNLYQRVDESSLRLMVILRLGVLLNRSRSPSEPPCIEASAEAQHLELHFPESWLDTHPMTRADLELEATRCREVGIELSFA